MMWRSSSCGVLDLIKPSPKLNDLRQQRSLRPLSRRGASPTVSYAMDEVEFDYSSNSPKDFSYLENNSIEDIAKEFYSFLVEIAPDGLKDHDYFMEEAFWVEKLPDGPLPSHLLKKMDEVVSEVEKLYLQYLFGDFIDATPEEIAQCILEWAEENHVDRLDQAAIDQFWEDRFNIDVYSPPMHNFQIHLQKKFLKAQELALVEYKKNMNPNPNSNVKSNPNLNSHKL